MPPSFLGVLTSITGAGSILGGFLVGRLIGRFGAATTSLIGAVLFAVGLLCRCVPWWPVVLAGSVFGGLGLPWPLVAATTAIQTDTPADLLGRVSSAATTAIFAPLALTIPAGTAIALVDHRLPFIVAAGSAVAVAVVGWRRTSPAGTLTVERLADGRSVAR